jgi:hypothetical protein
MKMAVYNVVLLLTHSVKFRDFCRAGEPVCGCMPKLWIICGENVSFVDWDFENQIRSRSFLLPLTVI